MSAVKTLFKISWEEGIIFESSSYTDPLSIFVYVFTLLCVRRSICTQLKKEGAVMLQ